MDPRLQRTRSRRADLPAHWGPPPFCPRIQAALDTTVRAALAVSATPPVGVLPDPTAPVGPAPPVASATPRWTLRRLVGWARDTFGKTCCRETIRAALHRLKLSWKKGKKLLSRADPAKRAAFVATIQAVLGRAQRDEELLVYIDEAHIHQDADVGYGWSVRGERLWVCSSSPGLSAKASFYGLYLYNEGQVRI